jgi:tRNA 2-thiouridine synthesizing protein A
LITTDPAAVIDVPHFCTEAGHDLLDQSKDDARMIFMIKRSS